MPRSLTVLVAVLALALVAGCGSSSSKKKSDTGTTSTSAQTTSASNGQLSKADYETRLVTALRPAQSAGNLAKNITKTSSTESDAKVFDQVAGIYQKAYTDIKDINPPAAVADLHPQVVAALSALAKDATKARDALRAKSKSDYAAALTDFKSQGVKLQTLGQQLTARGY